MAFIGRTIWCCKQNALPRVQFQSQRLEEKKKRSGPFRFSSFTKASQSPKIETLQVLPALFCSHVNLKGRNSGKQKDISKLFVFTFSLNFQIAIWEMRQYPDKLGFFERASFQEDSGIHFASCFFNGSNFQETRDSDWASK